MNRDDRKRREKRRASERTQFSYRLRNELRGPGCYPEITWDSTEGDGYFVAMVLKAAKELDFDSPEMGPDWMRWFYRQLKDQGVGRAYAALKQLAGAQAEHSDPRSSAELGASRPLGGLPSAPLPDDDYIDIDAVPCHFGDRVFRKIGEAQLAPFLPFNDFELLPTGNTLHLRFTSLLRQSGPGGTVYYSRLKPNVTLNGQALITAFSDHAIRQMCKRRSPRYLEYGGNGDAHTYLARCVFYEPVTLPSGAPAFCMYDICSVPGFRVYRDYVLGVLGKENRVPHEGECYYRLGYCPVVLEGAFAKAKSMLFPGFRNTPERAILESQPAAQHFIEWLERAEDSDGLPFYETDRCIEVTKWIHDNGIRQVIQRRTAVFADAD